MDRWGRKDMRALGILLGILLLISGIDLMAVVDRDARALGIPISGAIGLLPWLALAGYIGVVLLLESLRSARWRWTGFTVATIAYGASFTLSVAWLDRHTATIPLSAPLSQESEKKLREAYPAKWVSSGKSLRVRREDYSEAMAAFAAELAAGQPATK